MRRYTIHIQDQLKLQAPGLSGTPVDVTLGPSLTVLRVDTDGGTFILSTSKRTWVRCEKWLPQHLQAEAKFQGGEAIITSMNGPEYDRFMEGHFYTAPPLGHYLMQGYFEESDVDRLVSRGVRAGGAPSTQTQQMLGALTGTHFVESYFVLWNNKWLFRVDKCEGCEGHKFRYWSSLHGGWYLDPIFDAQESSCIAAATAGAAVENFARVLALAYLPLLKHKKHVPSSPTSGTQHALSPPGAECASQGRSSGASKYPMWQVKMLGADTGGSGDGGQPCPTAGAPTGAASPSVIRRSIKHLSM